MRGAPELIYIHDPMCSWCWGFRPCLDRLRSMLPAQVGFRNLLGGLAPDSAHPMPAQMQQQLQGTWRLIQQRIPGTRFNFDFWTLCQPRRSTYPACRAVLAAKTLDPATEDAMILAIQQAYYLRAMNPSDEHTLVQLAHELGLPQTAFMQLLHSASIAAQLHQQIATARHLGVHSFPSLVLRTPDNSHRPVEVDYTDAPSMLDCIQTLIA
jgi:putative protein-disulfide isomerase